MAENTQSIIDKCQTYLIPLSIPIEATTEIIESRRELQSTIHQEIGGGPTYVPG